MTRSIILAVLLAAPLAACGDGKEGTSISINSSDAGGNINADVDGKSGKVSIDTPMFKGKLTLPKLDLGSDNVELNGVHLYPGSKVTTMNIAAVGSDKDENGKDDDSTVKIVFDSPADPATVRDWFAEKLGKADFTLAKEGMSLVGTDDDKKPFRLDLVAAANGHATGTITAH